MRTHKSVALLCVLIAALCSGDWADGTKATGKKFSIRGATLIRVKDGKILFDGDYYDAYGFYKQLGLAQ